MKFKSLLGIAILSLLIVIWIDFIPFKFSELWEGAGLKFENIIHRISLAYITSFIFYYVVVYTKDRKNKKQLYPIIGIYSTRIATKNKYLLERICMAAEYKPYDKFPTLNEFENIINKIDVNSTSLSNISWNERFQRRRKETRRNIEKILANINFLDSEHLRIILDIQSSPFLDDTFDLNKINDSAHMTPTINFLYQYFENNIELYKYNSKIFSNYILNK